MALAEPRRVIPIPDGAPLRKRLCELFGLTALPILNRLVALVMLWVFLEPRPTKKVLYFPDEQKLVPTGIHKSSLRPL